MEEVERVNIVHGIKCNNDAIIQNISHIIITEEEVSLFVYDG